MQLMNGFECAADYIIFANNFLEFYPIIVDTELINRILLAANCIKINKNTRAILCLWNALVINFQSHPILLHY